MLKMIDTPHFWLTLKLLNRRVHDTFVLFQPAVPISVLLVSLCYNIVGNNRFDDLGNTLV